MKGKETEVITQASDKFKQRNVASMNVLILISIWTTNILWSRKDKVKLTGSNLHFSEQMFLKYSTHIGPFYQEYSNLTCVPLSTARFWRTNSMRGVTIGVSLAAPANKSGYIKLLELSKFRVNSIPLAVHSKVTKWLFSNFLALYFTSYTYLAILQWLYECK